MSKKTILNYVFDFIISILLFIFISLVLVSNYFISSNGIKKALDKNNYYESVNNEIINDLENISVQSGFEKDIYKDLLTPSKTKRKINSIIDGIYLNKPYTVQKDTFKKDLEDRLYNYIESNNLEIEDKKSFDLYVNKNIEIYTDGITIKGLLNKASSLFNKLKIIYFISLFSLLILISGLLFIKFKYLNKDIDIILFSSFFIFLLIILYLSNMVSIKYLFIYSKNVSNIIRYLVSSYKVKVIISMIILFISGVICNKNDL